MHARIFCDTHELPNHQTRKLRRSLVRLGTDSIGRPARPIVQSNLRVGDAEVRTPDLGLARAVPMSTVLFRP